LSLPLRSFDGDRNHEPETAQTHIDSLSAEPDTNHAAEVWRDARYGSQIVAVDIEIREPIHIIRLRTHD